MPRMNRFTPPTAKRSYWKADDVADFELTVDGNALKPGSMYISGMLQVNSGVTTYGSSPSGTALKNDNSFKDVKLDEYAGAHSLFWRINSETDQGIIENLDNYPRLIRMIAECNGFNEGFMNESDKAMGLMLGEKNFQQRALAELTTTDNKIPFVIKPLCALNTCNAALAFRRSGLMKVSVRLASVAQAFYGADNSSTIGYWVSDLKLHYEVVPDDGNNNPITFQKFQQIPHNLNSANANISSLMPGLSNSMCASFLLTSDDHSYTANNLKTAHLPLVTRVTFAFNDADNVRVSYPIESNEELQLLAQRALGVDGPNSLRLSRQQQRNADSEGFLIGVVFGQLVNLTRSKFDLQIRSDTTNGVDNSSSKYTAYLYFRGIGQF
jgi:hypothetical protein